MRAGGQVPISTESTAYSAWPRLRSCAERTRVRVRVERTFRGKEARSVRGSSPSIGSASASHQEAPRGERERGQRFHFRNVLSNVRYTGTYPDGRPREKGGDASASATPESLLGVFVRGRIIRRRRPSRSTMGRLAVPKVLPSPAKPGGKCGDARNDRARR